MRGELDSRNVVATCIIVGVIVGVISSIPVIWFPNICCLWIILGGFVVTYVSCREVKTIEPVEAALVGALFGAVYGLSVNVSTFLFRIPQNLLGLGVVARGVAGGGILNTLGIKLGMGMLGGLLIVILNMAEGIVFGALGAILYSVSVESDGIKRPIPKKATLGRR